MDARVGRVEVRRWAVCSKLAIGEWQPRQAESPTALSARTGSV
jgi:hypothetical protein